MPVDTLRWDAEFRTLPESEYAAARASASQRRKYWAGRFQIALDSTSKNLVLDSAGRDLKEILVHQLFPYWYGTPWAFEGYSDVPGTGEIACGYFLSTTLRHAGFNLNRYKLAQQASSVGTKILACGKKVTILSRVSVADMCENLTNNAGDGLYAVGLDYHTGFLLAEGGQVFFIHSTYLGTADVTIERAEDSPALPSSSYHIAPISTNRNLIRKWILAEALVIS